MNGSTDSCHPAPRLVLALPDTPYAAEVASRFGTNGWEVHSAGSAWQARAMAAELLPEAVVLAAERGDESGWLTCAKLVCAQPHLKVVLVSDDAGPAAERFGSFVGATALVAEGDGPDAVAVELFDDAVPTGR